MALIVIATPGASNANSYVTEAAATAYLEERVHAEPWFVWESDEEGLSLSERRQAALVTATRLLDEQIAWYGTPTTTTQALAWPQQGQVDSYWRALDSLTVPAVIQRATAYLALEVLKDTSDDPTQAATAAIKSRRIGSLQIVYQDSTATPTPSPNTCLPSEIRQMLSPYGTVSSGIVVSLLRT